MTKNYLFYITLFINVAIYSQVYQSSYIGNGSSQSISIPGVNPNFVLVKSGTAAVNTIIRTNAMTNASSLTNTSTFTDAITTMTNGFSVGLNAACNTNTETFHWLAIRNVVGSIKTGTYTGNGTSANITGLGFTPDMVMLICPGSTRGTVWRTSLMAGDLTVPWDSTTGFTGAITALIADGFSIGSDASANTNGTTYYYIAFKNVAGQFKVGTHTGDAVDNRSITGFGFTPDAFFVKTSSHTTTGGFKFTSTGASTDITLVPNPTAPQADHIQKLLADGIEVGTGGRANGSGRTYQWFAMKSTIIPLATTSFELEKGTSIFPNPTSSIFELRVNEQLLQNDLKVKIIDINGRNLFEQKIDQLNTSINLNNYTSGIYFVEITTKETKTIKRIIKN